MGIAGNQADVALARSARARAGVFTRGDAIAAGFTPSQIRRRVSTGLWVAQYDGVLRAATTPESIDLRERAALARAGDGAVLSHFSAARRWRLSVKEPGAVSLTVPYERAPQLPEDVRVTRSRHLPASAVRSVAGLTRP